MTNAQVSKCPMMNSASSEVPSNLFFNPRDKRFNDNPYPYYKRLREEDPVHRSNLGVWFLGRYDHVRGVLKDPRFSAQDIPGQLRKKNELLQTRRIAADQPDNLDGLIANSENWFAFLEAPTHTRLRGLVTKAFERRAGELMRPYIRSCAKSLIEEALPNGRMDLMKDFGNVLPLRVIATTLGLPPKDFAKLVPWINTIARIFDPLLSLGQYAALNKASLEFMEYLKGLVEQRRIEPQEDLISALIEARDDKDQLTASELISVIIIVFGAAQETVATLIGNSGLALFRHPDHAKYLRENMHIMPQAIEELLRFDAPLQMTSRTALDDVEIGGKIIHKGDQLYIALASANRDPLRFANADEIIFEREKNHHLSFGSGHHICVGAPLARIEGQEALSVYLEMLPHAKLAIDKIEYRDHTVLRAPISIPITF